MTGRGDRRIIRPSPHAAVKIGLTLSSPNPTILSPPATLPLTLSLTARLLATPRPELPITLAAYKNPFDDVPTNPSYEAMDCIFPASKIGKKRIEINPYGQGRSALGYETDLREFMEFITIPSLDSEGSVTVEHIIPAETVEKAGVASGEIYRAAITDRCLGALWWKFGEKPAGPIGFRMSEQARFRDEEEGEERIEGEMDRGEEMKGLALVVESGEVDFEVV